MDSAMMSYFEYLDGASLSFLFRGTLETLDKLGYIFE